MIVNGSLSLGTTLTVPNTGTFTGSANLSVLTRVSSGGRIMPPLAVKAAAASQTITFDQFTADAFDQIAAGYAGFNWTNFNTINGNVAGGSYQAGMVSAPNIAFNQSANPATISSPSVFNLISLYLTAVTSNLTVTLKAFDGSTLIATQAVTPSTTSATLYNLNLDGITSVTFTATAPSGDPFNPTTGGYFVMDNVTTQVQSYFGQAYAAGLNLYSGGTYDWQLGGLLDNSTGTPGTDFARLQVNGGNLSLGGTSKINVDLGLLAPANVPGGSSNNAFWNSSHLWTVASVTSAATNSGSTNFATITSGSYSTGLFATQIDPDGKSIDLVYNEMNLTAGAARNTVIGSASLAGPGGTYTQATLPGDNATLGSVDVAGLGAGNPLMVQFDLKGSASALGQWLAQLSGVQAGGPMGYTVSSAGTFGPVPAGDTAYVLAFAGLNTSSDTYINFDWTAGNSAVTLDELSIAAPEPSASVLLPLLASSLLRRRRTTRGRLRRR